MPTKNCTLVDSVRSSVIYVRNRITFYVLCTFTKHFSILMLTIAYKVLALSHVASVLRNILAFNAKNTSKLTHRGPVYSGHCIKQPPVYSGHFIRQPATCL